MVTVAAFMVTILAGIGIWFQIALADTNEDAILEGIYIDKKDDVIVGTVDRIEPGFILVNVGKTNAVMVWQ